MARWLPLKFRIAGIVFILVAIMIAVVLGVSMHTHLNAIRTEYLNKENVLVDIITNLSRTAMLAGGYAQLQTQIQYLVMDPHIVDIEVIDPTKTIVASSSITHVGKIFEPTENDNIWFWRTAVIGKENSTGKLGTVAIQFSHLNLLIAEQAAMERGFKAATLALIVTAIISIMTGTFLTRRLVALSQIALRIIESDPNNKLNIRGKDEIAIVGQAFDEITVARDYALNVSRAKDAFLANMSHELRTPLNAIIGYSEILLENSESASPESSDDLNKILAASNHLLSLINNLLNLAKINAGKMDLHIACFDIHEVVKEASHILQPMMTKYNNEFQVSCPSNIGMMTSDRTKIYQCLLNLLSNAAKYTHSGKVTFRVSRTIDLQQNWVEFEIEDTGIGIPENKMKNLFDEFTQMDSTVSHQTGTGLGLALTRRMSELLGGTVVAHSQLGVGSDFILRLPEVAPVSLSNATETKDVSTPTL